MLATSGLFEITGVFFLCLIGVVAATAGIVKLLDARLLPTRRSVALVIASLVALITGGGTLLAMGTAGWFEATACSIAGFASVYVFSRMDPLHRGTKYLPPRGMNPQWEKHPTLRKYT